jgi:VWFA-related protein
MLKLCLAAAIVLFSTRPAFSQVSDAPASFRSNVNLVTIPVVVRDPSGHAIGTLRKEDFQLFDKGKPQVISRFSIVRSDDLVMPAESGGIAPKTAKIPQPASRFVAYLFDDMHSSFADLAQARIAAAKHLSESMRPADRVAIFTTSGQNTVDFTDDSEKLREAMNRIVPRSRVPHAGECPDLSEYMADAIENKHDTTALNLVTQEVMTCRSAGNMKRPQAETIARNTARRVLDAAGLDTQASFAALKDAIGRMSTMPGQRTIVLVSSGFLVTADRSQDESQIIDRAVRARVAIGSLDARGLYAVIPGGDASQSGVGAGSPSQFLYQTQGARAQGDVLGELADGTGGTFFHNNNDLLEGFRRTSAMPEVTYVLGFAPQDLKLDGSFHVLKVTAAARDLTVQARRGYYAPKKASDPAEVAKEETATTLFSREVISEIPVQLETQFVKADQKTAKLVLIAHIDLKPVRFEKADGLNRAKLTTSSAVFDRNGILVTTTDKEFTLSLTDTRLEAARAAGVALKVNIDVAPGTYTVRLVMRDSEGHTTAQNGVVEIPVL